MEYHQHANIFPLMEGEPFMELIADIRTNGLLEPITIYDEKILDGRNRHRACIEAGIEPRFEYINGKTNTLQFVISKNLKRRHLNETQRAGVASQLANMPLGGAIYRSANLPTDKITQVEASKLLNVSERTIRTYKAVAEAMPELVPLMNNGKLTTNKAEKKVKEMRRFEQRAEIAKLAENIKPSNRWNIYHDDVAIWKASKQYDFIITDPPYPREYLPLYEILARRSVEWIKPGGLLVAMCGQSYLNQIYEMMSRHIEYYWTACYLTPGQFTALKHRNVNTNWKPLLIFQNGKYTGKIFNDVFISDGNDKSKHKWGQSESGMYSIVSKICLKGQSILDPFCGAGTTGIAALKHGCLFDGVDIDQNNANITKGRLMEYDNKTA